MWVVRRAHLNEPAVLALLCLLSAERVPHPAETLGCGCSGELPDVAGPKAAEDLGERLRGHGGRHRVHLVRKAKAQVETDDSRPGFQGPAQDLGVTPG